MGHYQNPYIQNPYDQNTLSKSLQDFHNPNKNNHYPDVAVKILTNEAPNILTF